jgi:hypothetical protein
MARQKRMEGTYDPIPEKVQAAVDAYLKPKRSIAALREKMNGAAEALVEEMQAAGLTEVLIDDDEKILKLEEVEKIRIESRKKKPDEE